MRKLAAFCEGCFRVVQHLGGKTLAGDTLIVRRVKKRWPIINDAEESPSEAFKASHRVLGIR